ncbi:MAG: MBL fold metallo-hydrolase [Eubacteriales bacterium]|nr:MBL fold metallo-hydrolase [Eubacteriales bacterium]
MNLEIECIINGELDENAYLCYYKNQRDAFIVDPGCGYKKILNRISELNLQIKYILLTHAHYDHIMGVNAICKKYSPTTYISFDDKELLEDPKKNYSYMNSKEEYIVSQSTTFEKREILHILDEEIITIPTPGHTKGGTCYYIKNKNVLFCGDTLFFHGFGRYDLYSGNLSELYNSINNEIFNLPNNTISLPGHGDKTTIDEEKKFNPIHYYDKKYDI